MDHDDSLSILALDGGGARGIYAAQMLARVEGALDARIKDCFNLIAGTSTGSILAGAAAAAIPMVDIVELFRARVAPHFQEAMVHSRYFHAVAQPVLEARAG